jgi:hypothetical protein
MRTKWLKIAISLFFLLLSSLFIVSTFKSSSSLKNNNFYVDYNKSSQVNIQLDSNYNGNIRGGELPITASLNGTVLSGEFKITQRDTRDGKLKSIFSLSITPSKAVIKWGNTTFGRYPFLASFSNKNYQTNGKSTPLYSEKSFILNLNYDFEKSSTPDKLFSGPKKIVRYAFDYKLLSDNTPNLYTYFINREILRQFEGIKKINFDTRKINGG